MNDNSAELAPRFADLSSTNGTPLPARNEVSITVVADVKLVRELTRLPPGIVAVTGKVSLGDWSRLCYNSKGENSLLDITFVVPQNLTQTVARQACVILSGPSSLLPLSRPSAVCVPPFIDLTRTKFGTLTGRADQTIFNTVAKNKDQCSNGSLLGLAYDSQTDNLIYLSPIERARITWNLEVVSLCLLIACAGYVLLRLIVTRRYVLIANEGFAVPQVT